VPAGGTTITLRVRDGADRDKTDSECGLRPVSERIRAADSYHSDSDAAARAPAAPASRATVLAIAAASPVLTVALAGAIPATGS
jgi:hypothetical protein